MEFCDLPEHIFLLILSFLPLVDAIRLCSCCKEWRNHWTHCNIIELDRSKFEYEVREAHFPNGIRTYIAAYVHKLLPLLVKPELDCIKLRLSYEEDASKDKSFFENLLGFAAAKMVKEIHIDLSDARMLHLFRRFLRPTVESFSSVYSLSYSIYNVTSLRVLSLRCCGLSNFNFELKFMQLTSLSFDGMFVTNQIILNLGSNCPNLENLSIVDCYLGRDHFQFHAAWSKLKRLTIKGARPYLAWLELFVPRIQYLEIQTFMYSVRLGNLQTLVEAVLDLENQMKYGYQAINIMEFIFLGFKWAKRLTLNHRLLEVLLCDDHIMLHETHPDNLDYFSHIVSCKFTLLLENLEHLILRTPLEGLALGGAFLILRSASNLKSVSVDTEYGIVAVNAQEVTIEGFIGDNDQMDFIEYLLRNSVTLKKVFISFPKSFPLPTEEIETLIKWTMKELEKIECYVLSISVVLVFQTDVQVCFPVNAFMNINSVF
ncbi:hypothetical protein Sjap_003255 [Stephania japonica]|uniref:F-box domain-containing protein n=1 Tax=Stephania japonica TaxID=461633 RepID=A0AAP0KR16_9MAGN